MNISAIKASIITNEAPMFKWTIDEDFESDYSESPQIRTCKNKNLAAIFLKLCTL